MNSRVPITRRNSWRVVAGFVAIILVLPLLAACGGSDNSQSSSTTTPVQTRTDTREPVRTQTQDLESTALEATATEEASPAQHLEGTPELGPDGHFASIQVADDGTKHLIPLDAVHSGGPPKDGIPSIDSPHFVGPEGWNDLDYRGADLVIGVEVNGKRRAYPFQILVWHELVNDTFEGIPLLVSYCPLCGTGIVFQRVINDESVEFGVSGKLYNSDLLMYDRMTDTLWSQITGTAVVGELTGEQLSLYPAEIMTWEDWRATYPDSEVLTRTTGHERNYDVDPYGDYYTDGTIWFPVNGTDTRLPAKERVTGVEIDAATFGAYPDDAVVEFGPLNDVLGDVPLLIVADPNAGNNIVVFERRINGQELTFDVEAAELVDRETGTRWTFSGEAVDGELAGAHLMKIVAVKGFWFAWYAFHPQTSLWQP